MSKNEHFSKRWGGGVEGANFGRFFQNFFFYAANAIYSSPKKFWVLYLSYFVIKLKIWRNMKDIVTKLFGGWMYCICSIKKQNLEKSAPVLKSVRFWDFFWFFRDPGQLGNRQKNNVFFTTPQIMYMCQNKIACTHLEYLKKNFLNKKNNPNPRNWNIERWNSKGRSGYNFD